MHMKPCTYIPGLFFCTPLSSIIFDRVECGRIASENLTRSVSYFDAIVPLNTYNYFYSSTIIITMSTAWQTGRAMFGGQRERVCSTPRTISSASRSRNLVVGGRRNVCISHIRPGDERRIMPSPMRMWRRRQDWSGCAGASAGREVPRFIQHKNEAKAFYAFLSQVYDYIVNPEDRKSVV